MCQSERAQAPRTSHSPDPETAPPLTSAGANAVPALLAEAMRTAAWSRLGVEYQPGSLVAEYARQMNLGAPLTQLFETAGHLVQGYYGGIVFAPVATPERIAHVTW